MKKMGFVAMFILIIAMFITIKAFRSHIQSEKELYAYQVLVGNLERLARSMNRDNIVFLGSSSIQGMNTGVITQGTMNLGIGGEKIASLSKRVSSYAQLSTAKAFVLMVGFNDICTGAEETYTQFKSFINNLPEQKPMVIVGLQPAPSQRLCTNLQEKIKQYNKKLKFYCNNVKARCQYTQLFNEKSVLYSKQYDSETNKEIQNHFESDEFHLNERGYTVLQDNISNALDVLLLNGVKEQ